MMNSQTSRSAHPRIADRVETNRATWAEAPHDWASDLEHSVTMDGGAWHSVVSMAVVKLTLPHVVWAEISALRVALVKVLIDRGRSSTEAREIAQDALFAGDRYRGSYAVPASWADGPWHGDQYLTRAAVEYLREGMRAGGPSPAVRGDFAADVARLIADGAL